MMGDLRLGFLGAGRMATALAKGFLAAGLAQADQILASDPAGRRLPGVRPRHRRADRWPTTVKRRPKAMSCFWPSSRSTCPTC